MAMVAIARDDAVLVRQCGLNARGNGLLTDIEVAKSANQAKAVKLPSLFLKSTDQEHFTI